MNTFPSFAETAAPPGQEPAQLWLRVSYDELKDAMPVTFHEVSSMRGPAGRVYKLRNHFPAGSADPKDTGWLTYTDSSSGQVSAPTIGLGFSPPTVADSDGRPLLRTVVPHQW